MTFFSFDFFLCFNYLYAIFFTWTTSVLLLFHLVYRCVISFGQIILYYFFIRIIFVLFFCSDYPCDIIFSFRLSMYFFFVRTIHALFFVQTMCYFFSFGLPTCYFLFHSDYHCVIFFQTISSYYFVWIFDVVK